MSKRKSKKTGGKASRHPLKRKGWRDTQVHSSSYEGPGFDYGVLPRIMLVGDLDFLNIWNQAGCVAMCHTVMPVIGVRSNVPVAEIGFTDYANAKKLFDRFKSWMKPPCDAAALSVAFITDHTRNVYFLYMGADPGQLVRRMLGDGAEDDYIPVGVVCSIAKRFPLSAYFERFRAFADGKEILICPIQAPRNIGQLAGKSGMLEIGDEEVGLQEGFFKSDIRFLDKELLARDAIEYCITEPPDKHAFEPKIAPPIPAPPEVTERRTRQLARFFPVTTARLPHNQSFLQASRSLQDRYAPWQIIQAACNLQVRSNWPELGMGNKANMHGIYEKLRHHAQSAAEDVALTYAYDVRRLEDQIGADMEYLHYYIYGGSTRNAEAELRSRGYL